MRGYAEPFKGKKITLMGLGLLGRGVGDAEFLSECGADLLITDKKTYDQLHDSVEQLKTYPNITFHLGGHEIKDFTHCDMVIKAAGVPLDSVEIAAAKNAGIPVYMSTALFAKYAAEAGATIVGVTGTRGKTTVAHMIHHSLISAFAKASADKRAHHTVFLGGNVRGVSTLAMLPEVERGDVCVLELDSWQLQGFGDLKISPHVAVFTNLYPDHMNYYGGDMEKYFADKANIFAHQKSGDVLIAGNSLNERLNAAHTPCEPHFPASLPDGWALKVPGEHNRDNAALAAAALRAIGLSDTQIRSGLESFESPEGRLQFVREVRGVKIYNDNNATTPEATIAALRALNVGSTKSNLLLIAGGADKGLELHALAEEIMKTARKVLLLAGTGTDKLKVRLPDATVYESLGSAMQEALRAAAANDVILFSPAFASFGMFKNEYDRNDEFLRLVKEIK